MKEDKTGKKLQKIVNIVIWAICVIALILWICLPGEVPIYHTGSEYHNGSKLPLLIMVFLPLIIFLEKFDDQEMHSDTEESRELVAKARRKKATSMLCQAAVVGIIVLGMLIRFLMIS